MPEEKTISELTFEELKLNDPRYIEWSKNSKSQKTEMDPNQAAVALNLLMWQYRTMMTKYSTRALITQCLMDNHMTPTNEPNVFEYKGKHLKVNFDITKDQVLAFQPTFTEVA